jgi:hypothetical protein
MAEILPPPPPPLPDVFLDPLAIFFLLFLFILALKNSKFEVILFLHFFMP